MCVTEYVWVCKCVSVCVNVCVIEWVWECMNVWESMCVCMCAYSAKRGEEEKRSWSRWQSHLRKVSVKIGLQSVLPSPSIAALLHTSYSIYHHQQQNDKTGESSSRFKLPYPNKRQEIPAPAAPCPDPVHPHPCSSVIGLPIWAMGGTPGSTISFLSLVCLEVKIICISTMVQQSFRPSIRQTVDWLPDIFLIANWKTAFRNTACQPGPEQIFFYKLGDLWL